MAFRHNLQQLLVRSLLITAETSPWVSTMQVISSARTVHSISIPDLPSRRGMFAELPVVSSMLPNRKHMMAQFSPHGLTLVPKSLLEPTPTPPSLPDMQAATTTASSATTAHVTAGATAEPTDPQQQAAIMVGSDRLLTLQMHLQALLLTSCALVTMLCRPSASRHGAGALQVQGHHTANHQPLAGKHLCVVHWLRQLQHQSEVLLKC